MEEPWRRERSQFGSALRALVATLQGLLTALIWAVIYLTPLLLVVLVPLVILIWLVRFLGSTAAQETELSRLEGGMVRLRAGESSFERSESQAAGDVFLQGHAGGDHGDDADERDCAHVPPFGVTGLADLHGHE